MSLPCRPERKSSFQNDVNYDAKSKSALQVLLEMGFLKHRALKALTATGNGGPQLAADWLLSHVADPTLDENIPREFVVYLCPVGPLKTELDKYMKESSIECGWNGAHNFMPHITLCSFIKVGNEQVQKLVDAFDGVAHNMKKPIHVKLDYFTSSNFIALFVNDSSANELKKLMNEFSSALKQSVDIAVEGYNKEFHVTLAYQYNPEEQAVLERLSKAIHVGHNSRWDLRLYSKDPRFNKYEVYNVHHSYHVELPDELELVKGDFLYKEECETSADTGWSWGHSWLTGAKGLYPENHTTRVAESDAWALHRFMCVTQIKHSDAPHKPLTRPPSQSLLEAQHHQNSEENNTDIDFVYAKVNKHKKTAEPRKIIVIRHGERVDAVYGQEWYHHAFDNNGTYSKFDLNMPSTLPDRFLGCKQWHGDTPLTKVGIQQADLLGTGLIDNGISYSFVYCSPAFRCIQTANEIIKSSGLKIRIEPALFEWGGWYKQGLPKWFTPYQYSELGYPIDVQHKPVISYDEININESVPDYYNRSAMITNRILESTGKPGNVLMVGHAATLDTNTWKLCNNSVKNNQDFISLIRQIPFCAVCICEETNIGPWIIKDTEFLGITHHPNRKTDMNKLLM